MNEAFFNVEDAEVDDFFAQLGFEGLTEKERTLVALKLMAMFAIRLLVASRVAFDRGATTDELADLEQRFRGGHREGLMVAVSSMTRRSARQIAEELSGGRAN